MNGSFHQFSKAGAFCSNGNKFVFSRSCRSVALEVKCSWPGNAEGLEEGWGVFKGGSGGAFEGVGGGWLPGGRDALSSPPPASQLRAPQTPKDPIFKLKTSTLKKQRQLLFHILNQWLFSVEIKKNPPKVHNS